MRLRAQDALEYGLLIATIVVIVLIGVTAFGYLIEPWLPGLTEPHHHVRPLNRRCDQFKGRLVTGAFLIHEHTWRCPPCTEARPGRAARPPRAGPPGLAEPSANSDPRTLRFRSGPLSGGKWRARPAWSRRSPTSAIARNSRERIAEDVPFVVQRHGGFIGRAHQSTKLARRGTSCQVAVPFSVRSTLRWMVLAPEGAEPLEHLDGVLALEGLAHVLLEDVAGLGFCHSICDGSSSDSWHRSSAARSTARATRTRVSLSVTCGASRTPRSSRSEAARSGYIAAGLLSVDAEREESWRYHRNDARYRACACLLMMASRISQLISAEGWFAVFAHPSGGSREHSSAGGQRTSAMARAGGPVPEFVPLVAWALVVDDTGAEPDRVIGMVVLAGNRHPEAILADDPSFLGYRRTG